MEASQFLRVSPETGLFFDSSYCPVPLAQQYIGISEQNFAARTDLLNEICYKKVIKQSYLFIPGRIQQKQLGNWLNLHRRNEDLELFRNDEHPQFALIKLFRNDEHPQFALIKKEVMKSRNKDLVELFESGAGVHHAGMLRADRGTCLHSNFGMG
uniref:Uncharacterized protein n=1 Tax=Salix viminalis TaxID=40686 RepID=A0A6N2NKK2_SALVM